MIHDLFDLGHSLAGPRLMQLQWPWEILQELEELIRQLGAGLSREEYICPQPEVWLHRTVRVAPTVSITGPCIVGPGSQLRQGAFLRGSTLIGENCVVGNSTELKNVILFDGVQVPHFNYVGDSILGHKAHFGAGVITSNVKADKKPVVIHTQPPVSTGRKKVGAMVGDFADIGCNSVFNPGTVIGRRTSVYPLTCLRGVIPADSIVKTGGIVVPRE